MSRRAKLLITATFLVPLCITVALLASAWSTRDPLQFRVESLEPGAEGELYEISAHLKVTNTSSIPVHLHRALLLRPVTSKNQLEAVGELYHWNQEQPVNLGPPLHIPPGASVSCVIKVMEYTDRDRLFDQTRITYMWRSGLTEKMWTLWRETTRESSKTIQELLPAGLGIFNHQAPVQPLPKTPPSVHAPTDISN